MSYRAAIQSLAAGLAIIGVVAAGSASFASSSTGPTALVVQPGDTLWGIAGAHGVTVDQLAALNLGTDDAPRAALAGFPILPRPPGLVL